MLKMIHRLKSGMFPALFFLTSASVLAHPLIIPPGHWQEGMAVGVTEFSGTLTPHPPNSKGTCTTYFFVRPYSTASLSSLFPSFSYQANDGVLLFASRTGGAVWSSEKMYYLLYQKKICNQRYHHKTCVSANYQGYNYAIT